MIYSRRNCIQICLVLLQVLEVTTEAMERRVKQDFADACEGSDLYRWACFVAAISFLL